MKTNGGVLVVFASVQRIHNRFLRDKRMAARSNERRQEQIKTDSLLAGADESLA